ncbi:hypothetical protein MPSEU_001037000 [Mayamaea pseudoterrestris]|nr:hypothetical protein MPSEU_001037000 [Mayamaea pseudoterrestris]
MTRLSEPSADLISSRSSHVEVEQNEPSAGAAAAGNRPVPYVAQVPLAQARQPGAEGHMFAQVQAQNTSILRTLSNLSRQLGAVNVQDEGLSAAMQELSEQVTEDVDRAILSQRHVSEVRESQVRLINSVRVMQDHTQATPNLFIEVANTLANINTQSGELARSSLCSPDFLTAIQALQEELLTR